MQDVGKVFLRYQLAHDDNETRGLLEVDVLVEGATVHVHLSEAKHWPYVIRNDMSDLDLAFSQKVGFTDLV